VSLHFSPTSQIIMYSYIISKKERNLGSTFASAYNDKHSITSWNSSFGYLAWPDDGLIREKRPKHEVIHL